MACESTHQKLSRSKYKKLATVQGPTHFYHWLIDRLPSIFLLKDLILKDSEIKLIINAGHVAQYVHSYLDLLGIPRSKRIVAQSGTLFYADTLYFATPFLMEPIPKKLLLSLRNELLKSAYQRISSRKYNDNLIIIIQREENNRQIKNLKELLNILQPIAADKNYQIVIFNAKESVSEQIYMFYNARLVIGVMASGLANILYTKPGTSIIEIHPTSGACTRGSEWVWWLSSLVGLDYWIAPAKFSLLDESLMCPIDEIAQILKKIFKKK